MLIYEQQKVARSKEVKSKVHELTNLLSELNQDLFHPYGCVNLPPFFSLMFIVVVADAELWKSLDRHVQ
jgi:hypothetical protein